MKKILLIVIISLSINDFSQAVEKKYFEEGKTLFENKEFKKAKFKFEQDIVQNPKSANSYLYLAKIFNNEKNLELEEMNLNTVLLLNPKNEEAIHNLTLVNLKKSDFEGAKKLIDNFKRICQKLCPKAEELRTKLENSLKK
tara:strand:- start:1889 stop:2311 length:423 start_codon:yes stop_codon:yes gene_type:complete